MSLGTLILILIAGSSLLFAAVWLFSMRVNNYSVVDAAWSLSFAVFTLPIFLLSPGAIQRKGLIAGMFALWSLRLGIYLTRRIFSHLDEEDRRYALLRKEYGADVKSRFFRFFQMQAASVVLLLGPLLLASRNTEPGIGIWEWVGFATWMIGLLGESMADRQLSAFRKNPLNRNRVCDVGLWHFSRHPNYFFEFVIWLGFGIFALGSPLGAVTLYAPLIMLVLLTKVTGIPYAEAQSLKSKGDLYRAYQARTSAFVPWFPRRD